MADETDISVGLDHGHSAGDEQGPLRLCAETRVRRPRDEMLRFVLGPDGAVVPDLAERLPGRGVWLTCDRTVVAAAIRSKAFARSFKRKADVSADLPDRLATLILRKLSDALSIANKAGLVTAGFAKVEAAIEAGGVAAVLHGSDGSDDGSDKLDRRYRAICLSAGRRPLVCKLLTIEQLSLALGRSNVVHAALGAGGAAKMLLSEIARFERYIGTGTEGIMGDREAAAPTLVGWDQGKRDL